jgi:hypothetical protein
MVYNFWTYHILQLQNSEIIRRNINKLFVVQDLYRQGA